MRKVYITPGDDARTALLAAIGAAQVSIRVAVFTLTLKPLIAELIARHQAGVDVQVIVDLSQSNTDLYEVAQLALLRAAGITVVCGTSSKHNLMHSKFAVIDGRTVISGSYNFTSAAQLECNVMEVESNKIRAALFLKAWNDIYNWILANEPAPIS